MTRIRDLAPLNYFGFRYRHILTAVGWLGRHSRFRRGCVSTDVLDQLRWLIERSYQQNNYQPMIFAGFHPCELCPSNGAIGAHNLFVPAGDRIFVCPELIVHYICSHGYRPPDVFQEAVLRCPDPRGSEYRELFIDSGGQVLMRDPD